MYLKIYLDVLNTNRFEEALNEEKKHYKNYFIFNQN